MRFLRFQNEKLFIIEIWNADFMEIAQGISIMALQLSLFVPVMASTDKVDKNYIILPWFSSSFLPQAFKMALLMRSMLRHSRRAL
ncbi:hypothetical protein HQN60_09865 [Deefgea piscis]|uniref:Uncharacterized protein n=1 Tax=Deefgea piscis TaxID=2739061 RepID=A0A6M8SS57_9NEIS|nr:hypothetical protein [Deefgea piscis]QKJ66974.1 hypothetical protein HQN60_09865 [Deefgea piscis]